MVNKIQEEISCSSTRFRRRWDARSTRFRRRWDTVLGQQGLADTVRGKLLG
jgi:hypothetical protein